MKALCVLLLYFTVYHCTAQVIFENYFGDTINNEQAGWITEQSDGTYLIAGSIRVYRSSPSQIDGCLLKADKSGNILWMKNYGTPEDNDYFEHFVETENNYMVFAGTKEAKNKSSNIQITKLDTSGRILWSKTHGGFKSKNAISGMVKAQQGGFILTGMTFDEIRDPNLLIMRLDSFGNVIWQKDFGQKGMGRMVLVRSNGNYLVVGRKSGSTLNKFTTFLCEFDTTGSLLRSKDILTDSIINPQTIFDIGNNEYLISASDGLGSVLIKVNDSFQSVWMKRYYTHKIGGIYNMKLLNNVHYLISGPGGTETNPDGYIAILDKNFEVDTIATYGGSHLDYFRASIITSDGSIAAVGTTMSYGVNNTEDFYFVKTNGWPDVSLNINKKINKSNYLHIFPNPNNGSFLVNTSVEGNYVISVRDITGKEYYRTTEYIKSGSMLTLSTGLQGLFFLEFHNQERLFICRVIIQ